MPARDVPWERAGRTDAPVVHGTDADLARAVAGARGAAVRFVPGPDSDVARTVGLAGGGGGRTPAPGGTRELAMDALHVEGHGLAVNMVVLGTAPDHLRRRSRAHPVRVTLDGDPWFAAPATTVVVATGQWLRGADVVPRGHPGDGRFEVQVYGVPPGERRALRARLATGEHLPHPAIGQRSGTRVVVEAGRRLPLEVDGTGAADTATLVVEVVPAAYRLVL